MKSLLRFRIRGECYKFINKQLINCYPQGLYIKVACMSSTSQSPKSAFVAGLCLVSLFLTFAPSAEAEDRIQTAASYVQMGETLAQHGDYVRAIGAFTIALEFAPDFAPAFFGRAKAYEASGKTSKAIADYTRTLDIVPELTAALYNRGNLWLQEGDLNAALSDFDRAVHTDPGYVMAYNNRGIVKAQRGDIEGAMADFNEAIRINAQRPEAFVNRGLVRLQQGRKVEAKNDFARSIALRPSLRSFIDSRVDQLEQLSRN
jgi:tetratricopeptide (TPR) repeat protein